MKQRRIVIDRSPRDIKSAGGRVELRRDSYKNDSGIVGPAGWIKCIQVMRQCCSVDFNAIGRYAPDGDWNDSETDRPWMSIGVLGSPGAIVAGHVGSHVIQTMPKMKAINMERNTRNCRDEMTVNAPSPRIMKIVSGGKIFRQGRGRKRKVRKGKLQINKRVALKIGHDPVGLTY